MEQVEDVEHLTEEDVKLFSYENEHLRETNNELEKKNESLIKERDILRETLNGLYAQRKEIQLQYNSLVEEKSEVQKRYEMQKKQQEQSLKKQEIEFEKKLNELKQYEKDQLHKMQQKENHLLREQIQIYHELNLKNNELNLKNNELLQNSEKLRVTERKLYDLEKQQDKLFEKYLMETQMVKLRRALVAFEKSKVKVSDPYKRAEEWARFFREEEKAIQAFQEIKFTGNIQKTVISLFTKIDNNIHAEYEIENTMELQKIPFIYNEINLISAD